ncbi:hypothetical protein ANN_27644 [Periplaneta americana]|uniref:PiggyBac transposable element-derived protein domain-containing protein n=1 Tax=Periplaneta americana TaxID=6978 RepID=A0ABQ8RWL1_PERAM|nr:hypothetical protein ANN_27644 [Periplaneta americana]
MDEEGERIRNLIDSVEKEMARKKKQEGKLVQSEDNCSVKNKLSDQLIALNRTLKKKIWLKKSITTQTLLNQQMRKTCVNRIRFKFLVTVLRFDDSNTRQERRSVDKLAPIRSLFQQIVKKCSENFTVSEYVTIDEMLESFREGAVSNNS